MFSSIESLVDHIIAEAQEFSEEQINNLTVCLKDIDDEWRMALLSGIEHEDNLLNRLSRDTDLNRSIIKLGTKLDQPVLSQARKKR